jgi:hypothetical protein
MSAHFLWQVGTVRLQGCSAGCAPDRRRTPDSQLPNQDQHGPQTLGADRPRPLTQLDIGTGSHPLVFAALIRPAIDTADTPLIDLPIVDANRPPRRYRWNEADRLGGLQPGRLHGRKQCLDLHAGHVKRVAGLIQTAHLEPNIEARRLARHDGSVAGAGDPQREPTRPVVLPGSS